MSNKLDQMMEIMNKLGQGNGGNLTEEMQKFSDEILNQSKQSTVEASSGANDVIIKANLAFEIVDYQLSENFFEEDLDTQNQLIKSATQQLLKKLQSAIQSQFKDMMF